MLDEPARLEHVIHLLVQRQRRDLAREPLDELHEAVHGGGGLAAPSASLPMQAAGGFPQRAARALRVLANDVEALRADAARRQVDDALERGIVARGWR